MSVTHTIAELKDLKKGVTQCIKTPGLVDGVETPINPYKKPKETVSAHQNANKHTGEHTKSTLHPWDDIGSRNGPAE